MVSSSFFSKASLLTVTLMLVGTAQASAQTTFSGTTSAVFGEPTGPASAVFSGIGTNIFSTGEAFPNSTENILKFEGSGFSTTAGLPFSLGDLDYTNGVTSSGSVMDSVPLIITLDLTSPLGISQAFEFDFDFFITPNDFDDPIENADQLIAQTSIPNQTFEFDDTIFTLELLGFTQDDSSDINNQFFAFEDTVSEGTLLGQITEAPVQDVPESMSLLSLALLGATIVSHRQKSSQLG